jgi:membrane-bound inhibitor of C-type lysozyme
MRVLAAVGALAVTVLVVWWSKGCRHDIRMPMYEEQICYQCGARRRYVLGKSPGPWRK